MALVITEYASNALLSRGGVVPSEPPLQTTVVSSAAAVSTALLLANTSLVRITCSANAWILFSGSSVSTSVVTSTNAPQIVPNAAPEYRFVKGGSRYTVLST